MLLTLMPVIFVAAATELRDIDLKPEENKAMAEALAKLPTQTPADALLEDVRAAKKAIEDRHEKAMMAENESYNRLTKTRRTKQQKTEDAKHHGEYLKRIRNEKDENLKTLAPVTEACNRLTESTRQLDRVEVYLRFRQDKKAASTLASATRALAASMADRNRQMKGTPVTLAAKTFGIYNQAISRHTQTLARITETYPDIALILLTENDKLHREILNTISATLPTSHLASAKANWQQGINKAWAALAKQTLSAEHEDIAAFWRYQAKEAQTDPYTTSFPAIAQPR